MSVELNFVFCKFTVQDKKRSQLNTTAETERDQLLERHSEMKFLENNFRDFKKRAVWITIVFWEKQAEHYTALQRILWKVLIRL